MSIECGECEMDLRSGHAEDCSRRQGRKAPEAVPDVGRVQRLALQQVDAMLDEARRRAVLDPVDIIDGLERLRRTLCGAA